MSVVTVVQMADQLFVPYRGVDRESSIVGTISVDINVTGAAGGGTILGQLNMNFIEFGFHPIWVPTRVGGRDNLATAEEILLSYLQAGNERIATDVDEGLLATQINGINRGQFNQLAVPIESIRAGGLVLQGFWLTNTDAKLYHIHAFGPVYDGEALARGKKKGKSVDNLLAGIR